MPFVARKRRAERAGLTSQKQLHRHIPRPEASAQINHMSDVSTSVEQGQQPSLSPKRTKVRAVNAPSCGRGTIPADSFSLWPRTPDPGREFGRPRFG